MLMVILRKVYYDGPGWPIMKRGNGIRETRLELKEVDKGEWKHTMKWHVSQNSGSLRNGRVLTFLYARSISMANLGDTPH
jgi:hypothetical protein